MPGERHERVGGLSHYDRARVAARLPSRYRAEDAAGGIRQRGRAIFDEPQQRQHVLDVGGVEELQPAELYERDVPARQFNFKRTAVGWMSGTALPAP